MTPSLDRARDDARDDVRDDAREGWPEANQRRLAWELDGLRARLGGGSARSSGADAWTHPRPPALDELCERFGLSGFERDVLLACAGVELDASFAASFASLVAERGGQAAPTFGAMLASLSGAHWSALAPDRPLRRWRLVELGPGGLTAGALRIDERVLHFLAGVDTTDDRLAGLARRVDDPAGTLAPSHQEIADLVAAAWTREDEPMPVVQLCGGLEEARMVAAAACAPLGLALHVMPATVLPAAPHELEALARLWEREAVLARGALLVECDDGRESDAAREQATARFLETAGGPLLVAGRERRRPGLRPTVTLDVRRPTSAEQRELWRHALGADAAGLDGRIGQISSHFDLGVSAIRLASAQARLPTAGADDEDALALRLWDASRAQARPRLDDLVERVEPVARWADIVLPDAQLATLRDITVHVRNRGRVHEEWGFGGSAARGLGITALFAGPSGTGKTMAAEVLANELRLDLYRIDLARVVSKYIGETEKNLARVFDAAEEGGAILLFDEADALFGRRTEVKDSHDRYANIEVSYLLQRMESYRGLAILTTNMKGAIDEAFQRRIRFVVSFPFPDARSRAEIWRRALPPTVPADPLDVDRLARLGVAGGSIRNIALRAAFQAADDGTAVGMRHLLHATRAEFAKLDRPLGDADTRGWT